MCNALGKSKSYSLFEICFSTNEAYNISKYARYIGYKKFKIPNCTICKNYIRSYDGMICKLYKSLNIVCEEKLDTKRARTCKYFSVDENEDITEFSNIEILGEWKD